MFERKSTKSVRIVFVLIILFLFSCAKQESGTGYKKIERDYGDERQITEQDIKEPTPESSAADRLVLKGIEEYKKNEFEKAGRTLEAAVNIQPDNGVAYYWLAKTNLKLGDVENSKQFLYIAGQHLSGNEWEEKLEELEKEIDSNQFNELENSNTNNQNEINSF